MRRVHAWLASLIPIFLFAAIETFLGTWGGQPEITMAATPNAITFLALFLNAPALLLASASSALLHVPADSRPAAFLIHVALWVCFTIPQWWLYEQVGNRLRAFLGSYRYERRFLAFLQISATVISTLAVASWLLAGHLDAIQSGEGTSGSGAFYDLSFLLALVGPPLFFVAGAFRVSPAAPNPSLQRTRFARR